MFDVGCGCGCGLADDVDGYMDGWRCGCCMFILMLMLQIVCVLALCSTRWSSIVGRMQGRCWCLCTSGHSMVKYKFVRKIDTALSLALRVTCNRQVNSMNKHVPRMMRMIVDRYSGCQWQVRCEEH